MGLSGRTYAQAFFAPGRSHPCAHAHGIYAGTHRCSVLRGGCAAHAEAGRPFSCPGTHAAMKGNNGIRLLASLWLAVLQTNSFRLPPPSHYVSMLCPSISSSGLSCFPATYCFVNLVLPVHPP
eukprot:4252045-Pleurochrysis_carterae.AAC.1